MEEKKMDNEFFQTLKENSRSVCNDCELQRDNCEWLYTRSADNPKGDSGGHRIIWCTGLKDNKIDRSMAIETAKVKRVGLPDIPS